jgi:hypothetical protein
MDDIKLPLDRNSPRFIDRLRILIRNSGLAYRTELTYIHWVKRFIFYHKKRHPREMGAQEVSCRHTQNKTTHLSFWGRKLVARFL